MTDEEQKKIFSKNLNYYISKSGKQQKEIAKAINENATTFNMWCKGKSMPSVSKIQKLADYLCIGKSDLTDDKQADLINDGFEQGLLIKKYRQLNDANKQAVNTMIESLLKSQE